MNVGGEVESGTTQYMQLKVRKTWTHLLPWLQLGRKQCHPGPTSSRSPAISFLPGLVPPGDGGISVVLTEAEVSVGHY